MYFNQSSNMLVQDIQEYAKQLLFQSSNSTNYYFQKQNYDQYMTQSNNFSDISLNSLCYPINQEKQKQFRPITKINYNSTESYSSSSSPCCESPKIKNWHQLKKERSKKELPLRSQAVDLTKHIESARKIKETGKKVIFCSFCKNNGEKEEIYCSHLLKDSTGKIICPVLKTHICPICHQTGEKAHTLTYCKDYKMTKKIQYLQVALDNILKE